MPVWLACRNLLQSKLRTAVGVAGVSFAVLLIFFQFGLLASASRTATSIYGALDFDVLIRSREYVELTDSGVVSMHRLRQAATVLGVRDVNPLSVTVAEWKHPDPDRREYRMMLALGVRPGDEVFLRPDLQALADRLTYSRHVVVDELSHPKFGPANGRRFSAADVGVQTTLNDEPVEIAGVFRLGVGFGADGTAIVSDRGFRRIAFSRADVANFGLVRLTPGADAATVLRRIEERLPTGTGGDVDVLTREQVLDFEKQLWLWNTSIGLIFLMGAAVACVVGSVVVYQVLASDVSSRLPEYATLKAMGYRDRFLAAVVVFQAVLLALAGFLVGWGLAAVLYRLTRARARLPMEMTVPLDAIVLGLALLICVVSGVLALKKLRQAAPADLF
jgi:putative ABC transport system permease protein